MNVCPGCRDSKHILSDVMNHTQEKSKDYMVYFVSGDILDWIKNGRVGCNWDICWDIQVCIIMYVCPKQI